MCTGIEIALLAGGAAASAGGALIERRDAASNAAAQAQARNNELRASIARQKIFEDRSRTEGVQKALARFSPEDQAKAQADATATRDAAIAQAEVPTQGTADLPLPTGNENAPTVVKDQIAKRLRDVFNTATDRAKLTATPLTYSDILAGNNVSLGEAGRVVDTGNSFARQEAAMLPAQQDLAAYAASQTPSIWGPVLKAIGPLAAGVGGAGVLAGAGALGTAGIGAGTALPLALKAGLSGRVSGPV